MRKIVLDEWLRTGRVAQLSIGDTVRDVIRSIGVANIFGPKSPQTKFPNCWLYDELEISFDADRRIQWIQADTCRIEESRKNPTCIDFDWQGIVDEMSISTCKDWLNPQTTQLHS